MTGNSLNIANTITIWALDNKLKVLSLIQELELETINGCTSIPTRNQCRNAHECITWFMESQCTSNHTSVDRVKSRRQEKQTPMRNTISIDEARGERERERMKNRWACAAHAICIYSFYFSHLYFSSFLLFSVRLRGIIHICAGLVACTTYACVSICAPNKHNSSTWKHTCEYATRLALVVVSDPNQFYRVKVKTFFFFLFIIRSMNHHCGRLQCNQSHPIDNKMFLILLLFIECNRMHS